MSNRSLHTSLLALMTALGLGACQPATDGAGPADRSGELGASEALAVTIDLTDEIDKEQLHEIAQYVEQNAAGEIAGAKVKVKQHAESGSTELEIVLMGKNLGDGAGLPAQLKSQFPALANADIAVGEAEADAQPMVHSDAEDPEEARQEILEQLQEQGLDGEIDVQVHDDVDGNREVEVKVKKEIEE